MASGEAKRQNVVWESQMMQGRNINIYSTVSKHFSKMPTSAIFIFVQCKHVSFSVNNKDIISLIYLHIMTCLNALIFKWGRKLKGSFKHMKNTYNHLYFVSFMKSRLKMYILKASFFRLAFHYEFKIKNSFHCKA